jgi:hypothetical protein
MNRPDAIAPKEFKAANVESRQEHDRIPRVDPGDQQAGGLRAEVRLAGGEHLCARDPAGGRDKVHLREALVLQQSFGHELRGEADAGILEYFDRRRLGRRLRRDSPCCQAEETDRSRQGQPAEAASPRPAFSRLGTYEIL